MKTKEYYRNKIGAFLRKLAREEGLTIFGRMDLSIREIATPPSSKAANGSPVSLIHLEDVACGKMVLSSKPVTDDDWKRILSERMSEKSRKLLTNVRTSGDQSFSLAEVRGSWTIPRDAAKVQNDRFREQGLNFRFVRKGVIFVLRKLKQRPVQLEFNL